MRARPRPPLWFEVLFYALGAALFYWVANHLPAPPHAGGVDGPPVQLAFFGWFIAVIQAIWTGVQAAATATVAALAATVQILWAGLSRLGNLALEIGRDTVKGFRAAWGFVRTLYEDVLKPAWQKFWKVIDWARRTLDELFRPVFKFLRAVRSELLKIYEKFIRPVLDTIELARHILKIFGKLGFEWAKTLDAKLASVEDKIDGAFRLVLRKVNDVINVVNRVVTLDGLFQRLAYIRTLERDVMYTWRVLVNSRHSAISSEQYAALHATVAKQTPERALREFKEHVEVGRADYQAFVDEAVAQLRIDLGPAGRGFS